MRRVVITGAGRGLGFALTNRWSRDGAHVFALARDPASAALADLAAGGGRVTPLPCDVLDAESIARCVATISETEDGIEILCNNAGISGVRGGVESFETADAMQVMAVNAIAPVAVTRSFLPLLRGGRAPRRVVFISSLLGSLADNTSGRNYAYRMSKCALNMAARNMGVEFADEEILSIAVHPGWVQTDMGGPEAPATAVEAAHALIATIEAVGPDASGGYFDREGRAAPW